ncbi:hypothetical protein OHD62_07490 [Mesorhizobium sp. YC-39]|uniref:hypothetical protein n=1 Tax=unclassified Mesorhizobium TaxID=325217 RepID=UPI0021E6D837|nr:MULTISPECIES: hypothetical protein [unclassified Mesorhizobium]MCV3205397.1 hypothetical protein [Mesorhizobium sp. YC-2]MCV3228204.1 hypothetical protein [Mesorhizobium sp. YC-39]
MTTTQGTNIDSSARALPAGPFEAAAEERKGSTVRDALMTGLLVIYPALATVAAIVAGLFLAGASGT